MSLDNLVRIRQLERHHAEAAELRQLLAAIRRSLDDTQTQAISGETRFDAAYEAIMQCALLALWASGYRTPSGTPGHHQTMIQSLSLTLDLPRERWVALDAFRRQRNRNDYSGAPIDDAAVRTCVAAAQALVAQTETWLRARRPEVFEREMA